MKINVLARTEIMTQILNGVNEVAIKKAVVRSVNRAATSVRAQAAREMKQRYNLPINGSSAGGRGLSAPGIKAGIMIDKSRYSRRRAISDHYSIVRVSSKPISAIHFVVGKKQPFAQKGVPIDRRPAGTKVAIQRGKTRLWRKAFVLSAKGSIQLYQRRENRLVKMAIPSLYSLVRKSELKTKLELFGAERFAIEMAANVPYFVSQLSAKGQ